MALPRLRPLILAFTLLVAAGSGSDHQVPLAAPDPSPEELVKLRAACPDYKHYSTYPQYDTLSPSSLLKGRAPSADSPYRRSPPFSDGPLALPFQRPSTVCRTFSSSSVEVVIEELSNRMKDKDLARIFENAFPNTLDTTVRWHLDGTEKKQPKHHGSGHRGRWDAPQSFIVTGDINAEWLRDSTNQLAQYQALAKKDPKMEKLILGAIQTQAEFVIESPYCNAFQPPPPSRLPHSTNGFGDNVHPTYEPSFVFECKYELDSLASFLALGNQFHRHTKSTAFLTPRWFTALDTVLKVLERQSEPTFDPVSGRFAKNEYTFQRHTNSGTETLSLDGVGNPLNAGTGLIRSAFRPSDDATVFGFFIPANAMVAVELKRAAEMLKDAGRMGLSNALHKRGTDLEKAVWEHGVVKHKKYGDVFAYEVDGYGSTLLMDDANVPSLLSLPLLGFVDKDDKTYANTRKMILGPDGNPYYLKGRAFKGIGGPHIGLQNAWPMSLLVQAMTSDDDDEIMECLHTVRNSSRLGLVHESINVNHVAQYTRSWFAWANSVFAQTILDLARRKPHLLFGEDAEPYVFG